MNKLQAIPKIERNLINKLKSKNLKKIIICNEVYEFYLEGEKLKMISCFGDDYFSDFDTTTQMQIFNGF